MPIKQPPALKLLFDDKIFNPVISSGALGPGWMDDFDGDSFDHMQARLRRGASIKQARPAGRPIQTRPTPPRDPRWGAKWKQATKQSYLRFFSIGSQGRQLRDSYEPS